MNIIGFVAVGATSVAGVVGFDVVEQRLAKEDKDQIKEVLDVFKDSAYDMDQLSVMTVEELKAAYLDVTGEELTDEQANLVIENIEEIAAHHAARELLDAYKDAGGERIDFKNLTNEEIIEKYLEVTGVTLTDEQVEDIKEGAGHHHRRRMRHRNEETGSVEQYTITIEKY